MSIAQRCNSAKFAKLLIAIILLFHLSSLLLFVIYVNPAIDNASKPIVFNRSNHHDGSILPMARVDHTIREQTNVNHDATENHNTQTVFTTQRTSDGHPLINFFGDNIYAIVLPHRKKYMRNITNMLHLTGHIKFIAAYNISKYIKNNTFTSELERQELIERNIFPRTNSTNSGAIFPFRVLEWKHIGCWISHITAFEHIIERKHIMRHPNKPLLILEDDIEPKNLHQITTQFNHFTQMLDSTKQIQNWEFMNIGRCYADCEDDMAFHMVNHSAYFVNLSTADMHCTHAYMIRNIDVIERLFSTFLPIPRENIDDHYRELSRDRLLHGYATYPPIWNQDRTKACEPYTTIINATRSDQMVIHSLKKTKRDYDQIRSFRQHLRWYAIADNTAAKIKILLVGHNMTLFTYYAVHELFHSEYNYGWMRSFHYLRILAVEYDFVDECNDENWNSVSVIQRYKVPGLDRKLVAHHCTSDKREAWDFDYVEEVFTIVYGSWSRLKFVYINVNFDQESVRKLRDFLIQLVLSKHGFHLETRTVVSFFMPNMKHRQMLYTDELSKHYSFDCPRSRATCAMRPKTSMWRRGDP
eukprot:365627_1